jgi:hypothetical protein
VIFQAYILGDDLFFVPIGEPFEAKTCLEAVQMAREYWPGLHPVIEEYLAEVKLPA